jgi:hypothetical protein
LKTIKRAKKIDKISKNLYDKYQIHSLAAQKIIDEVEVNDILIFNYSDFIWTLGSLDKLINLMKDPKIDVVSCHPLTLNSNSQEVKSLISNLDENKITKEAVVELSLKHSSWWYNQYTWGNNTASDYMTLIYFPIDESSFIFRGFHIHPLAFKGKNHVDEKLPKLEFGTLDGIYLPRVLQKGNWNNYFIQDQNEVCIGALSDENSATYTGVERNFIKKFREHVLKTHNKQEIENSKYFSIISSKLELTKDFDKIAEISQLNIENALTSLEIGLAERDYGYLIKQRQIYEGIEDLTNQEFKVLGIFLVLLRITIDMTIRPLFLVVRSSYKLKIISKKLLDKIVINRAKKGKSIFIHKIENYFGTNVIIPINQDIIVHRVEKYQESTSNNLKIINRKHFVLRPIARVYFEYLVTKHRRNKYERS